MRTLWMLLFSMFVLGDLEAQKPVVDSALPTKSLSKGLTNDKWKLPPGVSIHELKKEVKRWIVVPQFVEPFLHTLQLLNARIVERNISTNCFVIEIRDQKDIEVLLHSASVRFLQPLTTPPREELLINGFDLGTNRINLVHEKYPSLNGSGLVVSVKENKLDTTDIDFKGRFISTGLSSSIVTGHASIMATMIAGGGNSYYLGRGAAWNCHLSSANFGQLLPSSIAFYNQFGISVENHSYGTGIENFYGGDAAAYDDLVSKNTFLVHVFSSGNSGTSSGISGNYSGIPNFANLTGSFKMAKNIITVGATDSFANVELLSSRGPAFDGRVKPELVAFGQDGSSGAAALVSGTAILIQQAFKNQHHDSLPPASLVKAALINGADELGSPGPDFISGFGSLNAKETVRSVLENRYILSSITDKGTQTFPISVPPGARLLKITMAYTDLPAQANAFKALINDVDLELMAVSTGQIWKPWVLNTAPNKDSLLLPATRKKDSLNNVEQISIDNPAAGNYLVKIYGYNITNASQAYTIVYQVDSMDQFEWNFPMKNDPVFAGGTQVIRWAETFDTNGVLEFSGRNGSSWQLVSSNVDLENKDYRWQVPDSFSTGLLRMTVNGKTFQSDTFVISKNIQLQVGFVCEDSVLFNWNRINKADHYRVFALSSNFLESVALLTDTFFIFPRNAINSKHFTVAPIQGLVEGIRAFTINYETQGVGCYVKSFLAQLSNDKASAQLELGTLFHLKQIEIQRDNGTDFLSLQTISNPSQLSFQFDNLALHVGVNRFRAKLSLTDGRTIYSGIEIVYYLGKNDFIIYPNPTSVNKGFVVLRKDLDDATMVLSDLYGRRIMRIPLLDIINPIKNIALQRGVYLIAIYDKNGNRKYTQKIVMQ